MYRNLGMVYEFKHGYLISQAMRRQLPLAHFSQYGEVWGILSSRDALVFIDNHDTQRDSDDILTYKNKTIYIMAQAFTLAFNYGMPRIMSSYMFTETGQGPPHNSRDEILSPSIHTNGSCIGGWICEHRWSSIKNMIGFRNIVKGTNITNWWDNAKGQIAFSRGNKGFIAINTDWFDLKQTLQTGLPVGRYCNVIDEFDLNARICYGGSVDVASNGTAVIHLPAEVGIVAIHSQSKL